MWNALVHQMTSTEVINLKLGIYSDLNYHELYCDNSANKENEMTKMRH